MTSLLSPYLPNGAMDKFPEFSLFTLTGYDTLDYLFAHADSISNADCFIYPIEESVVQVMHNNCPRPGDIFNDLVVCFVAHTAHKTSLTVLDSTFYATNQDDVYIFCPQVFAYRVGVIWRGSEVMAILLSRGTGMATGYVGTGPTETTRALWKDLNCAVQPNPDGALAQFIENKSLQGINFSINADGHRCLASGEVQHD